MAKNFNKSSVGNKFGIMGATYFWNFGSLKFERKEVDLISGHDNL